MLVQNVFNVSGFLVVILFKLNAPLLDCGRAKMISAVVLVQFNC